MNRIYAPICEYTEGPGSMIFWEYSPEAVSNMLDDWSRRCYVPRVRGFARVKTKNGDEIFQCFDNTDGEFFMEDFHCFVYATAWLAYPNADVSVEDLQELDARTWASVSKKFYKNRK